MLYFNAKIEEERLRELRSFDILDTPESTDFNTVTALAARYFDAPICLVSFVDLARQWFKSHHGLDASETPREQSFCNCAVLDKTELYVEDATKDSRFIESELVTGHPNIKTYLGAPLITPNGHALGTLCVIYDRVTPIPANKRHDLGAFRDIVMSMLETRKLVRSLLSGQE